MSYLTAFRGGEGALRPAGGSGGRAAGAAGLGGDPAALLEDELPVHRVAVPGHRHGLAGHQADQAVQGAGPLVGDGVGAERGRSGRLDQVSGEHQVGIGHHDDQIAVGVTPAEMSDLHPTPAEVEGGGDHDLPVRPGHLGRVDAQSVASAVAAGEPSRSRTDSCAMVSRSAKAASPNAWS